MSFTPISNEVKQEFLVVGLFETDESFVANGSSIIDVHPERVDISRVVRQFDHNLCKPIKLRCLSNKFYGQGIDVMLSILSLGGDTGKTVAES